MRKERRETIGELKKTLASVRGQVLTIHDHEVAELLTRPLADAANAIEKAVLYLDEVLWASS